MKPKKRVFFIRSTYFLLDIFFAGFSIMVACWVRESTLPFSPTFENLFIDYTNPFHFVFVFWVLAVLFFNNINGLYQTRREILESIEIWQVFKSVCFSSVFTIVAIYSLKIEDFPRSILILSAVFMTVTLSFWRIVKRGFVEFLVERGYNNFNVLIIGAGKVGMALAEEIRKRPGFGLRVVGYLDDFKPVSQEYAGHQVIGKPSDFIRIVRKEFINKIFITIHHDSQAFLRLLEEARSLRVAVRVIPQGFELTTGEFFKYNVGFIPVLEYSNEAVSYTHLTLPTN